MTMMKNSTEVKALKIQEMIHGRDHGGGSQKKVKATRGIDFIRLVKVEVLLLFFINISYC